MNHSLHGMHYKSWFLRMGDLDFLAVIFSPSTLFAYSCGMLRTLSSLFHKTKLWAYLDSLIKSLFLRLLCTPKGFSSRQPTFIKDSVENTWDKLNWAVPVQNSNAHSARTRCKAVGILGTVNHNQGLQRQVHLLETTQCVGGYGISLL